MTNKDSVLRTLEGGAYGVDFLGEIIDHVAHPIFVKDREFRWVLLNRAFCDMVGYSREELMLKSDHDFFPEAEANFFRKKDVEMFSTGMLITVDEEPITDRSGRRHVLATTKVPLRDADGKVTHLVGIIHDITRLKAAEDALREINADLERRVVERTRALHEAQDELVRKERLAVLGQLAGGLAHQIRNPLASITNAAYIVQHALADAGDDDATAAAAIILEEAWRANRIITDLLDYARVRPPVRRAVALRDVVERALAAQSMPVSIAVERNFPALPNASIDADQVRDVFENLIRNAVEAMPGGGKLSLGAESRGADIVAFVSDTGQGIPREFQSRLFEPLFTTKPLGLGLGLATARALVENQGGLLTCTSALGSGARFEVRLPKEDSH